MTRYPNPSGGAIRSDDKTARVDCVPKQIEYWSQIGKIAEENPDLPFFMIRDILIADQEAV
ncbi:MAG: hypothetical protein HQ450_13845, partial [Alcaligenaceae bacterium]|nr:hypothetical protein [Alcaligenaceae bacterium]